MGHEGIASAAYGLGACRVRDCGCCAAQGLYGLGRRLRSERCARARRRCRRTKTRPRSGRVGIGGEPGGQESVRPVGSTRSQPRGEAVAAVVSAERESCLWAAVVLTRRAAGARGYGRASASRRSVPARCGAARAWRGAAHRRAGVAAERERGLGWVPVSCRQGARWARARPGGRVKRRWICAHARCGATKVWATQRREICTQAAADHGRRACSKAFHTFVVAQRSCG